MTKHTHEPKTHAQAQHNQELAEALFSGELPGAAQAKAPIAAPSGPAFVLEEHNGFCMNCHQNGERDAATKLCRACFAKQ